MSDCKPSCKPSRVSRPHPRSQQTLLGMGWNIVKALMIGAALWNNGSQVNGAPVTGALYPASPTAWGPALPTAWGRERRENECTGTSAAALAEAGLCGNPGIISIYGQDCFVAVQGLCQVTTTAPTSSTSEGRTTINASPTQPAEITTHSRIQITTRGETTVDPTTQAITTTGSATFRTPSGTVTTTGLTTVDEDGTITTRGPITITRPDGSTTTVEATPDGTTPTTIEPNGTIRTSAAASSTTAGGTVVVSTEAPSQGQSTTIAPDGTTTTTAPASVSSGSTEFEIPASTTEEPTTITPAEGGGGSGDLAPGTVAAIVVVVAALVFVVCAGGRTCYRRHCGSNEEALRAAQDIKNRVVTVDNTAYEAVSTDKVHALLAAKANERKTIGKPEIEVWRQLVGTEVVNTKPFIVWYKKHYEATLKGSPIAQILDAYIANNEATFGTGETKDEAVPSLQHDLYRNRKYLFEAVAKMINDDIYSAREPKTSISFDMTENTINETTFEYLIEVRDDIYGAVDPSAPPRPPKTRTETFGLRLPAASEGLLERLTQLQQRLQTILSTASEDNSELSKEYERGQKAGIGQSQKDSQHEANQPKNRYLNIGAYDHSRVKLNELDEDPHSTYINANHIYSPDKKEYIAAQGPLQTTTPDFWRMMWEKGSSTIVMVTNEVEKRIVKCHRYWAPAHHANEEAAINQEIDLRNEYTVTLTKAETHENYIKRTLKLTDPEGETKEITQFQYIAWPDHGVPTSPEELLAFHAAVRADRVSRNDTTPKVVHCSAGVGRTGTYIGIDMILDNMQQILDDVGTQHLTPLKILELMRTARNLMIQTEEQYEFVYKALKTLVDMLIAKLATSNV